MPSLEILVVDDEPTILAFLQTLIESFGYKVRTAVCNSLETADEIVQTARSQRFDIAIIGILMPGLNGMELAEQINRVAPTTKLVLAFDDVCVECARVLRTKGIGAECLPAPFDHEDLRLLLERLCKPSLSTAKMAYMLFALTTDKDGQNTLIEAAGLRSVEGLSLAKAQTEIVFLNLSAIYVAVFRYNPRNEKLDWMYAQYLALFKGIVEELCAEGEEELLQVSEARLNKYNKIHDLWREAHEKGRANEQIVAIGEAFSSFCGTPHFNPISLSLVQHHFFTLISTVIKTFNEYALV
jgi:CheY-like chemotaxis protein